MIVGCYSMDLYCDNELGHYPHSKYIVNEFPDQYTAGTRNQCIKQARKDGWIFHRDGRVTCPRCNNS